LNALLQTEVDFAILVKNRTCCLCCDLFYRKKCKTDVESSAVLDESQAASVLHSIT